MADNQEPNKEPKEQMFPRIFAKCPNCGSARRMTSMIIQEMIDSGKANPNLRGWMLMQQTRISDPSRQWLSTPILITLHDACYDCGTVYVFEAGVKIEVAGVTQNPNQHRNN